MQKIKSKLLHCYYTLLAKLAHHYLDRHQPKIIGINGSVGKTSCRMIIHQTLEHFFPEKKISTSPKNFNGELGLSLSIFEITKREPTITCLISTLGKCIIHSFFGKKKYEIIILEYGIDTPKEMEFLLKIAKPDIGVFTAIDSVHSEQFGSPAGIAEEEIKMALNTKEIVFLNANDPYAMQIFPNIIVDKFTYQTQANTREKENNADLRIEETHFILGEENHEIKSTFSLFLKSKKIQITTNLLGKTNYGYIAVALAIVDIFYGYDETNTCLGENILTLIYQLQPGRMSLFAGKENAIILDSTYNAAPRSMREVIDTAIQIRSQLFSPAEIWLILGDMRELGDLTEQEHRQLAGYVSQSADKLFLLGESMTNFLADELDKIGFATEKDHFTTSLRALNTSIEKELKKQNDKLKILVFKGSQNTIFLEESVKHFLQNEKDEQYLTRQSAYRKKKKSSALAIE